MMNFIYSMVVCLLLAAIVTGYADPEKTNNPRTSRASLSIQNSKLSTARGFGKRDGFIGQPIPHASFSQPSSRFLNVEGSFDSRGSYPNSWLIDELQNNPELAKAVVEKYVDENGDGELTSDELRRRNSIY